MITGISADLAKLVENHETDATYVVGASGNDYLIGASSGGTVSTNSVNGKIVRERLSAADSPSDRISSSYQYLSDKFASGGSLSALNESAYMATGNLFRGEAVMTVVVSTAITACFIPWTGGCRICPIMCYHIVTHSGSTAVRCCVVRDQIIVSC